MVVTLTPRFHEEVNMHELLQTRLLVFSLPTSREVPGASRDIIQKSSDPYLIIIKTIL